MWKGSAEPPRSLYRDVEYTVKMGDTHVKHTSRMAIKVPVRDIVVHKYYNPIGSIQNDIALALLDFPVNYSSHIQPVCVPEKAFMVQAGTKCWVTGWGKLDEKGETVKQGQGRDAWCPGVGLPIKGRDREAIF